MSKINMKNRNCVINIFNYAGAAPEVNHEPEPEPEPESALEEREEEEEPENEDEGPDEEEEVDEEWHRLWPLGTDAGDPLLPMPREAAEWDIFWPCLRNWWQRFGPAFFRYTALADGKGYNYSPQFFLLESDGNHAPPPPSFDLGYEPLWYWFITYSEEWFEEQAALSMRRALVGDDDDDDDEMLEYFPPTKKNKK